MNLDCVYDHERRLLATILYAWQPSPGLHWFTPPEAPLQVGVMKHPKGHVIQPHLHNRLPRQVEQIHEVLFVVKGRLRCDFSGADLEDWSSRELQAGDVCILHEGVHGFAVEEDCEIWEVRNGPYLGRAEEKKPFPLPPPL